MCAEAAAGAGAGDGRYGGVHRAACVGGGVLDGVAGCAAAEGAGSADGDVCDRCVG